MQRFFEEATALVMPMALKARRPVSMKTPQPRSSVMPMALQALRAVSKIRMTLKRNNPVHIQSDSISCCAVEAPGYNTTTACTMAIDGTSPGKKTRREPRALGYLTHTTRAHQKNICRAQKPDSKRCCVLHADCKQREPPSYVFYGRRVVDKHCFQKDRISCQRAAEDSTGYPSVEEDPSENVDRADIGRTGRIQICMLRIRGDTTSRSLLFLRRLRRASVPLRVEALYLFALEPDVQRPLVRV